MAVSVKSSGVSTPFSVRAVDASDLENTGLSDFMSASTSVYTMDLDNSANAAATFFKVYDNVKPSYGVTHPNIMIKVAVTTRQVWSVAQGVGLSNGLSMMAAEENGPTATTAPLNPFNCSLVVT